MAGLSSVLRNHLKYNIWATNRLLDEGAKLDPSQFLQDFGTADKSVGGTLTHLFRSERIWLSRILREENPNSRQLPSAEQWDELRHEWSDLHAKWRQWADQLSDKDAEALLQYNDLKGQPWQQPIWQIVLHVVNHSTHHRGQVSGFLRALGKTPPPLDFIAFMRSQS